MADPMTTQEYKTAPRLLVVDDEAAVLRLLKIMLARANYQVTTCQDAAEALRLMSQGAQFDCLVTDAMMPSMTGYELVRTLRNNSSYPDIPVLMLTRRSDRSDVKRAVDAGVTDYVLKPIDEMLLLDKIGTCLKTHQGTGVSRGLREVLIHNADTVSEAAFEVRIVSVRESGMLTRFPIKINEVSGMKLGAAIFKDIGIPVPYLKLMRSDYLPQKDVPTFSDYPYETEFSFAGIEEQHLKKIRAWLQKQEILRKK
jgi:CheY-like chemotaxis protein